MGRMRRIRPAVLSTALLVLCSVPAVAADVTDSFDRADSPLLGKTTDGAYEWLPVWEKDPAAMAIRGKQLIINYNIGRSNYASANLPGFKCADVDITVKAKCWYGDGKGGRWHGLSYRLADKRGIVDGTGYHVLLSRDGVKLTFAKKTLAEKPGPFPVRKFNKIRSVATGDRHRAYVNDALVLDMTDGKRLKPGFVGLTQAYEVVTYDDFSLTALSKLIPVTRAGPVAVSTKHLLEEGIYPQGKRFPLGLYSIGSPKDMKVVQRFGWNLAHTYGFKPAYLQTCTRAGMFALPHLPGKKKPLPESKVAAVIRECAANNSSAWWNLPEERRYWRKDEMAIVTNYSQWTRKYDPKKRPNYMYMPGNYLATDVKPYVPHLDIIPASVYTTYCLMPHAWVRWRTETTVEAIRLAGAKIGPDYLNGEKTPVAVIEMFHEQWSESSPPRIMSAAGAYHDFWQCIVSGAQGIIVFSYFHRLDRPEYQKVWQAYCKAASEIAGPEQLGPMVLHGRKVNRIKVKITAGVARTVAFIPHGTKLKPVSYPAIDTLATEWNNHLYVIAVNSADDPVTAELSGLPEETDEIVPLFEEAETPVKDGTLKAEFTPLGVHIYKVPFGRQAR